MASIEDRLDREDWEPVPGSKLVGTITALAVRKSRKGALYPVMTVRDDEGAEHVVSCALFADDVIAYAPSVGERVGVKFCGPRDRRDGEGTYDKFIVAFEKEPVADVDWTAMAEGRGLAVQAAPAVQAVQAVQAADPVDGDPWADTEPESVF